MLHLFLQVLFISLRELFGTAVFTFVACVFNGDRFSIGITYTILQASAEISRLKIIFQKI